jgi:hypothetical protein
VRCRTCCTRPRRESPSFEAREGPGFEKNGGLKGAQGCEAADQFRRLGVAPARHLAGAFAAEHLDFLDEHEKIAEAVRRDPGTRSEKSRDRSQRVDSATGAAILDPHARQELELSRTA